MLTSWYLRLKKKRFNDQHFSIQHVSRLLECLCEDLSYYTTLNQIIKASNNMFSGFTEIQRSWFLDLGSLYLGPLENILRRLLSSSMNIIYNTDAKSGFYPALKLLRIKSKLIKKIKKKIRNYRKLRIISFSDFRDSSPPLLKEWIIHKISDIVELQNCLLCHSFLKGKLPTFFESFFQSCSDVHNAPTRFSKSECFYMPRVESAMA